MKIIQSLFCICSFIVCEKAFTQSITIVPNPFVDTASVRFSLTRSDTTSVYVYDLLGQLVKTIIRDTVLGAGQNTMTFDGRSLPSGMYIVKLICGQSVNTTHAIKQSQPASIDEIVAMKHLSLYPNPIRANLIKVPFTEDGTVEVSDLCGRGWPMMLREHQIDIFDLPSGIYFLRKDLYEGIYRFVKE